MSGLASAAGAYEEAEGNDADVRRGCFVGEDQEQEDYINLLTLQRSEVS